MSKSSSAVWNDATLRFDRRHLRHPYSALHSEAEVWPVVEARGVYLTLADGRKLIDGMSSWWAAIHGYNHPRLNTALKAQLDKMAHVMFGGLTHPAAIELGQALCELLPSPLDCIFFCDSGSVSVEAAIKMALQYQQAKGAKNKTRLLTIRGGYHGDTFAAMSVCDPENGMHQLFSDILPKQIFVSAPRYKECEDQDAIDELERTLEQHADSIAAMILEPIVQGAGGMHIYHPSYLHHARELCNQYDVLLIFDEIATGFGRTGTMFAMQHADVVPDIICVGKALGAGYLTIAATITTETISHTIDSGEAGAFMHGPTYMANPSACAVASANIELLKQNRWQQQISAIEQQLLTELDVCNRYDSVREVRVIGTIGIVELHKPVDVAMLCEAFVAQGVWIRPFRNLVYIMPPYIIRADELSQLTGAIRDVVRDKAAT